MTLYHWSVDTISCFSPGSLQITAHSYGQHNIWTILTYKIKYLQCKCSAKSNSVEVEMVNGHKTLEARLLILSCLNSQHWLSLIFNHDEYLFLVLNMNPEYYTSVQTRWPWLLLLTLRVMRNFSQEVPPHQPLLSPCLPLLSLSPPSLYPSNPSSFSFAPARPSRGLQPRQPPLERLYCKVNTETYTH